MMYSPEVRERPVRMVSEHRGEHRSEWAAICSIAEKFGCSSETLRKWIRWAETDQGLRPGLSSDQLGKLYRENRSCGGRMRSCGRRLRISPRRSSTADPADDRLRG